MYVTEMVIVFGVNSVNIRLFLLHVSSDGRGDKSLSRNWKFIT